MKTIKICFLVLAVSCLLSLKSYSQSEFASVDDVYHLIQGNWYRIIGISGMTGKPDSIYDDHVHQIERIPGTDSITWKISLHDTLLSTKKYRIEFTQSRILHENEWMLTGYLFHLIIYKDTYGFATAPDVRDGGAIVYARNKLTTAINPSLQDKSILSLFPNPTVNSFMVTGIDNIKQIKVLDSNGNLVHSKDCNEPAPAVDISALSNGIYLVQVISKSGIYTGKIIKN